MQKFAQLDFALVAQSALQAVTWIYSDRGEALASQHFLLMAHIIGCSIVGKGGKNRTKSNKIEQHRTKFDFVQFCTGRHLQMA